jgi:hypothetical protein
VFLFLYTVFARWFVELDRNSNVVLRLLELNEANAGKLLKEKYFLSKYTWEQTQNPHSNPTLPETHLYFRRLPKNSSTGANKINQLGRVEPVSPKMIKLNGENYAAVLISGLSQVANEACCVHRYATGFQNNLPAQHHDNQNVITVKLVQIIQILCNIWSLSGNYLDSEEAKATFGQSISSLQKKVDFFTCQPIDLRIAAPRLTVLLALLCTMESEQIKDYQLLNQVMTTAAVYAVRCCREDMLQLWSDLVKWFDKTTTKFVSEGRVCAEDRNNWMHVTGNLGLDRDIDSLGEIVSYWDEFSAQKYKSPPKTIALLQYCLENSTISSCLDQDDRAYCSDMLIRIQRVWQCADVLCKKFSQCTFPLHYLYCETFSLPEQILACRHAVLIERAIIKCISTCCHHIRLRQELSNLFCTHNYCLAHMQVVYAEVYEIKIAGISAKLAVTASNIHKWFPFLDSQEFFQCLQNEESTQALGISDKILCLHLGDSYEMGLIPSNMSLSNARHIGTVNRSCLRCLHRLKLGIEKFIPDHLARKDLNHWLHDDSGVSISQLKHLVLHACMNKDIKLRKAQTLADAELNFAFGVKNEILWQTLDSFPDAYFSEHSRLHHTSKSLWMFPEPGSSLSIVHQLDKFQAALDIFSNFSGFNIDNRLFLLKETRRIHKGKASSIREILLSRYSELHNHLNQDVLESICKQIQALNANDMEVQDVKTYSDQNWFDDIDEMHDHDHLGVAHAPQDSPNLFGSLKDSEILSDQLLITPEETLKNSPQAAKFSKSRKFHGKRKDYSSASRRLVYKASQSKDILAQTVMNRDQYYNACRFSGVIRQVQINTSDCSAEQTLDCKYLSVAAVLPNPYPDILTPLFVLVAQIPINGRTFIYSSCSCLKCQKSLSQTETKTIFFFNSIQVLHLRPLCMCVDVMQHVLKQCIGFLDLSINPFCGISEDSDEDLKLEILSCIFHTESKLLSELSDMNRLSRHQVVAISMASGVLRSNVNKFLSVLVKTNGLQELSHAIVHISSVQKERLKELCRKKKQPETQLYCLSCRSFYVTSRGYICRHNKVAHKFLHPPSNLIANGVQSASADVMESDSEEVEEDDQDKSDSGSNLDDQDAIDSSINFVNSDSIQNDSYKKQASSSSKLNTEEEYFDSDLAKTQTGYVMKPTLSSKQGAKAEFDITYGNSPEKAAILEEQATWTSLEFLTQDKTSFDLCSAGRFEGLFLPPDRCFYCSHERSKESESESMKTLSATVYLADCRVCQIPAKFWRCGNCHELNCYDGRGDGFWFYSQTIGFSMVLILRQLKGFVHCKIARFSAFVDIHNDLVRTAMNNAPVKFVSENIWRRVCFSAWSTFPDLRYPCSLCLLAAVGSPPVDLRGETLDEYKRRAPRHVWDAPAIIQDAISNFVVCLERDDNGAGTLNSYPVEQETSILDRSPIPTGGFITLSNGKEVYKNALNATSEQRTNAKQLRELFKKVGKQICDLCNLQVDALSTYRIDEIDDMKRSLQSAWHPKQKEANTDHPLTLLLDLLNAQNFPPTWPYAEKVRFMFAGGILCKQIGAQASVFTLIKDWVVSKILNFCRCMSDTYTELQMIEDGEPKSSDILIQKLQTLEKSRLELLDSLAPNADMIPADPTIFQLVNFTSACGDGFLEYRAVNLAISSTLKYLAYCVCEISSRHKIYIEGCEDTAIFNPATDTLRYSPVKPLRSYLRQDEIPVVGLESEISGSGTDKHATYNPVKTNCALYFTPEAEQIRSVPYTGVVIGDKQDGDCTKKSYKEDSVLSKRNNSEMLSVIQCLSHSGNVIGYTIIFKGEGRKDVYYPIAAYKPTPPALLVYDHACG